MSIDPISRVQYFNGEALLTSDFQDEQAYHKGMRERLSRGVLTAGVLVGLDVEWNVQSTEVTVRAGEALDCEGQLIVLTDDWTFAPSVVDGYQNFLTIRYDDQPGMLVSNPFGAGSKRWIEKPTIVCGPDYEPGGLDVLLAVIRASGGAIQGIYYHYGQYSRQRVSGVLQAVQFVSGLDGDSAPLPVTLGPGPQVPAVAMSVAATDPSTLTVTAPNIDLNGMVTADSITAGGAFTGTFSGTFVGDGRALQLPDSTNYWKLDGDDIYYTAGNVAIGDNDASSAHLTVRQGQVTPMLATGLISLDDKGTTVTGYQTRFTDELKVGHVITYDFVPEQTATISAVISSTQLEIEQRLKIDLGPCAYSTQHGSASRVPGTGLVTASGTTVICQGGTFPSSLASGDMLIMQASKEDSPKALRVQQIISDTELTVVSMSPAAAAAGGPKLSAFAVTPSMLLAVGGAPTENLKMPEALAVVQNSGGANVPNSVGVNVDGGALNGNYALEVRGACQVSRWPIDPTDPTQLLSVGATANLPFQGLSVMDNGAAASVGATVSINVDTVDPKYSLDVGGLSRVSSLEISAAGSLKAASEIDTDKIGPFTPNGSIEVTSDLTIDTAIKGSGTNPLTVAGGLEVKEDATIDGALTVAGSMNVTGEISGRLKSPIPGPLDIDAPFRVLNGGSAVLSAAANNVTVSVDLYAQGDLNVVGALTTDALTVAKRNAQGVHVFGVSDDGDVSITGSLIVGSNGDSNFEITPDGNVSANVGDVTISKGALSVGSSLEIAGDGSVKLLGMAESWACNGIKTSVNPFLSGISAGTDGFLMVDIDPDSGPWNTSTHVLITVATSHGFQYHVRALAILGQQTGRGCSSATVPIQKGSTVSFTFEANSNSVGGANISICWIPFGVGNLQGMQNIN